LIRCLCLIVAFLPAVLIGCADGQSVVTVHVDADSGANFASVTSLKVTPSDSSGKTDAVEVLVGRAIPPAVDFGLRFQSSVRGVIHVEVRAVDSTGTAIASGRGDVTVAPSKSLSLPITLTAVVAPPPDSHLVFQVQPTGGAAKSILKPPVQVVFQDTAGKVVTATNAPVTLAIGTNPSSGHLGGTVTVAAVAGVATFPDLTVDTDGDGYTLTAAADSLPTITSAPFNIRPPSWVTATGGIFGGNITALASDQGNPITLYAGTEKSGVFKSTNLGGTWAPVSNGIGDMAIVGLAVAPGNGQVAYATTATAVYQTTNGGTSWTVSFTDVSGGFNGVAIDPANANNVYVGGFSRVIKTANGGTSWSDNSAGFGASPKSPGKIKSLAVSGASVFATGFNNDTSGGGLWRQNSGGTWAKDTGMPGIYPNWVAVSPSSINIIFVATDGGLYATNDGGGTWTQRVAGAPNYFKPTSPKMVVFDPSNSMNLYAASNMSTGGIGGVFRSSDGGASWNYDNSLIDNAPVAAIVVDKNNGSNHFAALADGVYKSTGGSWSFSSAGLTGLPIQSLVGSGTAKTLYAGTYNGGVFKTTDGGMNWGPASGSATMALPRSNATVGALVLDPATPATVYAGINFGGIWKTVDSGASWIQQTTGVTDNAIVALAMAPSDPMLLYAGTNSGTIYKTTNGGTQWTSGNSPVATTAQSLIIDPTASATVYVAAVTAANAAIQKTTTGSTSWSPLTTGLPSMGNVNVMAIDGASNMTLYAGLDSGAVYRSTDGGASWSSTTTFTTAAVIALAAHPTAAGILLAGTQSAGVYRSTDGGTTWSAINGGLESLQINALAFDRANPTQVYAGTLNAGVYQASF